MQLISSRLLRNNPSEIWDKIKKEEVVITVNGKPKAIIMDANEEDLEEILTMIRRTRAEIALEKLRLFSKEKGLDKISDKEIENEINNIRKNASSS
jgi:prevent-host-death family protein